MQSPNDAMDKYTPRELFPLRQNLTYPVTRYLLSIRRLNGSERAEQHLEIARICFEFIFFTSAERYQMEAMRIHDYLADTITNHLNLYGFVPNGENDYESIRGKIIYNLIEHLPYIKKSAKFKKS